MLVGMLCGIFLRRDVELDDCSVRGGFKFAVGADVDGIWQGGQGRMFLGKGNGGEDKECEKSERKFHGRSSVVSVFNCKFRRAEARSDSGEERSVESCATGNRGVFQHCPK